jgi:hypothetical protein
LKIALRAGPTDRTCSCCCTGLSVALIVLLLLAVVTTELGPDAIVCAVIGFTIAYDDDTADVHNTTIIADIIPYSINLFLVIYKLKFETKSILNFASKALCLTIICYIFSAKNIIEPTKK